MEGQAILDVQYHASHAVADGRNAQRKVVMTSFYDEYARRFSKTLLCATRSECAELTRDSQNAESVLRWAMCDGTCSSEVAIHNCHALKGEVKAWLIDFIRESDDMHVAWMERARSILRL